MKNQKLEKRPEEKLVKNQGRIEKEKTLKQVREIASLPSKLQLKGFQFPLSPEHRLNTPNAPDEEKAKENDTGAYKGTETELWPVIHHASVS